MSKFKLAKHERAFEAKLLPLMRKAFFTTGIVLSSQPKRAEDKQLEIVISINLKEVAADLSGHMRLRLACDYLPMQSKLSLTQILSGSFDVRNIGPDDESEDDMEPTENFDDAEDNE